MTGIQKTRWSYIMRNSRMAISAVAIALAVLALTVAPVTAQEATDDRAGLKNMPAPGDANSVFVVPGAAFAADGGELELSYAFWFGTGAIAGAGTAGGGCVRAPVMIPDDGEVYQFYASVIDNDPADFVWLDLWRADTYTGVTDLMAEVETTSDSASVRSISDFSIANPDLNYPTYNYYVTSCLGVADQKIFSARLWYHPEGIFDDGFGTANTVRWSATVD